MSLTAAMWDEAERRATSIEKFWAKRGKDVETAVRIAGSACLSVEANNIVRYLYESSDPPGWKWEDE